MQRGLALVIVWRELSIGDEITVVRESRQYVVTLTRAGHAAQVERIADIEARCSVYDTVVVAVRRLLQRLK